MRNRMMIPASSSLMIVPCDAPFICIAAIGNVNFKMFYYKAQTN